MQKIQDFVGKDLIWKRKWFSRKYELTCDEKLIAQIDWPKAFRAYAVVESAEGQWEIKRRGYWRYKYSIYKKDTEILEATFLRSWDTILTFSNGTVYRFDRAVLAPDRIWRTSNNTPLIRYFARIWYIMQIEPEALKIKELSLLAILGIYLIFEEAGDIIAKAQR